jgi:hypothetical protein
MTESSSTDASPEPEPEATSSPERFSAAPLVNAEIDPKEEAFYAAALARILLTLLTLTFLLLPFAFWRYGTVAAIGFAAGGLVSWLNFRSLASGVRGLADRIVNQQSTERGGAVVSRFLLRYLLVGGIAYAIFVGSPVAFRGFLWGLTLPVGAMLIEAAFEGFTAFRR